MNTEADCRRLFDKFTATSSRGGLCQGLLDDLAEQNLPLFCKMIEYQFIKLSTRNGLTKPMEVIFWKIAN